MSARKFVALGAILTAPVLLAGCAGSATPNTADGELTPITLALDWIVQPSNGAFILADELGYYEEAGLDVTIQSGGTSASSVQVVAGGGAEFGIEGGAAILQARQTGIEAVSILPVLQRNPFGYLYHSGQDIDSIADLNGRTVYAPVSTPEWEYLVEEYELDDVDAVQFQYTYGPFIADETAVAQGYVTSTVADLEAQGVDVEFFETPNNVDYMGSLFTTEDFIDSNPDTVRAFVEASLRGWQYYYDNNDEASEILAGYIEDSSLENITASGIAQRPYVWTDDVLEHSVGWQTEERWDAIADLQVDYGTISDRSVVEGAWTTEFLPE